MEVETEGLLREEAVMAVKRRSMAVGCVAAVLLMLAGCAGQLCFQPLACYKLPTYGYGRCPPPGEDWCRFRAALTPEQMGARVIVYDDISPRGRAMNPADVR